MGSGALLFTSGGSDVGGGAAPRSFPSQWWSHLSHLAFSFEASAWASSSALPPVASYGGIRSAVYLPSPLFFPLLSCSLSSLLPSPFLFLSPSLPCPVTTWMRLHEHAEGGGRSETATGKPPVSPFPSSPSHRLSPCVPPSKMGCSEGG